MHIQQVNIAQMQQAAAAKQDELKQKTSKLEASNKKVAIVEQERDALRVCCFKSSD